MTDPIKCSVCGAENEIDVHFCRQCGNPIKTADAVDRKVYRGHRVTYVALILIAAAVIGGMLYGQDPGGPKVPPNYLNLNVRLYDPELTLTNENEYDIENVVIALNPKTGEEGHTTEIPLLKAGDTIALNTNEFTNDSGGRFNSMAIEIFRVKVTCDTPKGRLDWETEDIPSR